MTPEEYKKFKYQQYLEDKWTEVRCRNCGLVVGHKDFGNNDVVVDDDLQSYHRDCCPCQWGNEPFKPDFERLGLANEKGECFGHLFRCPLCGRIEDDNGNEVCPH